MRKLSVLARLAADYPQIYLNPDRDTQESYRLVVLQGEEPETKSIAHYRGDPADREEMVDTPAGSVRVVTLGSRRDFELTLRGLMAAKDGPDAAIPASQGAAMLTVFNWPRIHAHLAQFPEEERAFELKRFTAVKENYVDVLVVLSRGPYSGVPASAVGGTEDEWLARSDTIRRYHELTHVICRRLYPGDIAPSGTSWWPTQWGCTPPSGASTRRWRSAFSASETDNTQAVGWAITRMRRRNWPHRSAPLWSASGSLLTQIRT